jgi:hypothetical protein
MKDNENPQPKIFKEGNTSCKALQIPLSKSVTASTNIIVLLLPCSTLAS